MEGTEEWVVGDLTDGETKEWNSTMIENLFTNEEVETILSIPLSLRQQEDKYVWHFDKRGAYSVRSGYHLAQQHVQLQEYASTSSGGQHSGGDLEETVACKCTAQSEIVCMEINEGDSTYKNCT